MNISLRPANEYDLPLIMAWRSNPLVYQGFYLQNGPLVWENHVKWFRSRGLEWRIFIVLFEGRPIGVVNISQLDLPSPEIGYYIGEVSLWGKGLGTEAVRKGLEWLKDYSLTHPNIVGVYARVFDHNIASVKLIEKLGFVKGAKSREGESYYNREL